MIDSDLFIAATVLRGQYENCRHFWPLEVIP